MGPSIEYLYLRNTHFVSTYLYLSIVWLQLEYLYLYPNTMLSTCSYVLKQFLNTTTNVPQIDIVWDGKVQKQMKIVFIVVLLHSNRANILLIAGSEKYLYLRIYLNAF